MAPLHPPLPALPTPIPAPALAPRPARREAVLAGAASMALFACAWWMWTDTGSKGPADLSGRAPRVTPPARASSVMFPRALPVRGGGYGHINASCPVHPDGALARYVQEERILDWRGSRVALCGASCSQEWQGWSDARRDAFLRECGQAPSGVTAGVEPDSDR